MYWSASVLTTNSADTEPTVILTFDSAKYVFNAGENTIRAWLCSKQSFRKTRAIFVTSVGTQRCSGVAGLLMSLSDASINKLDVVGPEGLAHLIATMRSYTYRSSLSVNPVEASFKAITAGMQSPSPIYEDGNISAYAIPLFPSSSSSLTHSQPSVELDQPERTAKRKRSASPPSSSKRPLFDEQNDSAAPSYQSTDRDNSDGRSLKDMASLPSFHPISLSGEKAQEWRRMMIEQMFPRKEPPIPPKPPKHIRQKSKKQEATEEITTGPSAPKPPLINATAPPTSRRGDTDLFVRLPPYTSSIASSSPLLRPTMSYVIVGPRVRGKFDAKKAQELKIPKGPIRGRLSNGETVTFTVSDGKGGKEERTVRAEDCVGPTESAQTFMLLDVPTPDHIPSLVASFTDTPFYARFRSKSEEDRKEHPVHVIFHLCGKGVLEDERYKSFMSGFSDETHHIISSREHSPDCVSFPDTAYAQLKLNHFDSDMFPIPKYDLTPQRDLAAETSLPTKTTLMQANMSIDIRPPRSPVLEGEVGKDDVFHSAIASKEPLPFSAEVLEKYAEAKAKVEESLKTRTAKRQPGDDVIVIPLGTSSAVPSKYRNVSSTVLQIPGWGNIMLDCGEGTWGQLVRSFGDDFSRSSGVWQFLRELKCIFLSHGHGDHHMGLTKLLTMRQLMNPSPTEPLYVIGIRAILLYVQEHAELEDLGLNNPDNTGVVLVLSDALNWRCISPYPQRQMLDVDLDGFMSDATSRARAEAMCQALGLQNFTCVDVYHRTRCYGTVIRHMDGWSIVFSGDTAPCGNLIKAGQNATLLIHEASMRDEEEEQARAKAHSTFRQAIDIGRKMHVQHTLLTHFSARYHKSPHTLTASSQAPILTLAYDLARLRIGDMWKMNMYLPVIENVAEELEDTDEEQIVTSWD